jgi:ParB family chromosome partitioning protein
MSSDVQSTTMVVKNIPLEQVLADDDFNCRGTISVFSVKELADDIRITGLTHAVVVKPITETSFKLVAGFRRFLACKSLGWTTIPCNIMSSLSDEDAMFINLSENIQREQLNIRQEAEAIKRIKEKFKIKNRKKIGDKLSKGEGWVQVREMMMDLPVPIQNEIVAGIIKQTDIRQLYTVKIHEGDDVAIEKAREIKESRLQGRKPQEKKAKNYEAKRARNHHELQEMIDILHQGGIEFDFWSRCFAWASGEISTFDLFDSAKKYAEDRGLSWVTPKERTDVTSSSDL